MGRYRIVTYKGIALGLRKGQTAKELYDLYEQGAVGLLDGVAGAGEVDGDYYVLGDTALFPLLIRRNAYRRPHRKRGFIRGTRTTFSRAEGEPEVSRPRLGKDSGKLGGARAATHARSHIKGGWVPLGTQSEDCYICRGGLKAAIRYQNEQFFNWRKDKTLQSFDQLPEQLQERFEEPRRHRAFIERWKALEDRVKIRFLRFAVYCEKKTREQARREWERKQEEERERRRQGESEDVLI